MPTAAYGRWSRSRMLGRGVACLAEFLLILWATTALYFDFPIAAARLAAAVIYGSLFLSVLVISRDHRRKLGVTIVAFLCVLAWWLSLPASNSRNWQPDVAKLHGLRSMAISSPSTTSATAITALKRTTPPIGKRRQSVSRSCVA